MMLIAFNKKYVNNKMYAMKSMSDYASKAVFKKECEMLTSILNITKSKVL